MKPLSRVRSLVSRSVTDGPGTDDLDEPYGGSSAPLPIYERDWVHPSELGAITARDRWRPNAVVLRASALVALVSLALSLAFVRAVNSSQRTSPRARALVSQSVNATTDTSHVVHPMVGTIVENGQPVVAIGDGSTIVAPAGQGLAGRTVVMRFGGIEFVGTIDDTAIAPGLQLIRLGVEVEPLANETASVAATAPVAPTAPTPNRGDLMTVHGAQSTIGTAVVGIASGAVRPLIPVDPTHHQPVGCGPAFDSNAMLLGWIVERHGALLLIPVAELLSALPRLATHDRQP